jgi:uncharacterized protein (DUF3820 family)
MTTAAINTIPLTDSSPMPFGKHRGKPMRQVPAVYLLWLFKQQGFDHPAVKHYIIANMDELIREAEKAKR